MDTFHVIVQPAGPVLPSSPPDAPPTPMTPKYLEITNVPRAILDQWLQTGILVWKTPATSGEYSSVIRQNLDACGALIAYIDGTTADGKSTAGGGASA